MYRGFNLHTEWENDSFFKKGEAVNLRNKLLIEVSLEDYMSINGSLDGTRMQNDWFPEIEADIFLSHSHSDLKIALTFSGWLYEKFGLITFIDSLVWKYANDLLKVIDEKYCKQNSELFDYQKRNLSTSYVHMMLSTALTMMIDKSECFILLNTPNSINASRTIEGSNTNSPWLYHEISISQMIRKKIDRKSSIRVDESISGTKMFSERLNIEFQLKLSHLKNINDNDLANWFTNRTNIHTLNKHSLDLLYEFHPLKI